MLKHCLIKTNIPSIINPQTNSFEKICLVKKRHLTNDSLPHHGLNPTKRQRGLELCDIPHYLNMPHIITSSILENSSQNLTSSSWDAFKLQQNRSAFLTALSQTSTQSTTPASSENNSYYSQNFFPTNTTSKVTHDQADTAQKHQATRDEKCRCHGNVGLSCLYNELKKTSSIPWNKEYNNGPNNSMPYVSSCKTINSYSSDTGKISHNCDIPNTNITLDEKNCSNKNNNKNYGPLMKSCAGNCRNIFNSKTIFDKDVGLKLTNNNSLKIKQPFITNYSQNQQQQKLQQQTISSYLTIKKPQQQPLSQTNKDSIKVTMKQQQQKKSCFAAAVELQTHNSYVEKATSVVTSDQSETNCTNNKHRSDSLGNFSSEQGNTSKHEKKEKKCTDSETSTTATITMTNATFSDFKYKNSFSITSKSCLEASQSLNYAALSTNNDRQKHQYEVSNQSKKFEETSQPTAEIQCRDNNLIEDALFENQNIASPSQFKDDKEDGYIITPGKHRICINTYLMQADSKLQQLVCNNNPGLASIYNYGQDIYTKWREIESKISTQSYQLSFKPGTNIERFRRTSISFILQQVYDWGLSSSTAHASISNINRVLLYYVQNQTETTSVLTANMFINTVFACLRMAIKHEETLEKMRHMHIISTSMCKLLGIKENDPLIMLDNVTTNVTEEKCIKILSDPVIITSAPEFLNRYLLIGSWPDYLSKMYYELALYLVNLALFSRKDIDQLSGVPPSLIAAAALSLSIRVISSGRTDAYECWPQRLVVYTGYGPLELKQAVRGLSALLRTKPEGSEVLEKFHPAWASFDWK